MSYFNPRSYKRSDKLKSGLYITAAISIHAPTRGATRSVFCVNIPHWHFNPRSYKRSDSYEPNPSSPFDDFNPRSYKRSDLAFFQCTLFLLDISIHAPTRGATIFSCHLQPARQISIHAPTRGATVLMSFFFGSTQFQSTLLQEERHFNMAQNTCALQFQSTLLQEERRCNNGCGC